MKIRTFFCIALLFFGSLFAAAPKLTSVTIIDRNGVSETISSKQRIEMFQKTNFLQPQPYQKVIRQYARNSQGNHFAQFTTYHPNGQLKQYLESTNHRAYGFYREYYSNGQLKVDSYVIGGVADLNAHAESTWLFHGLSKAFDEEGHLSAQISYNKGDLEGTSFYFHSNGNLWKRMRYHQNKLHGLQEIYLNNGSILQTYTANNDFKDGESIRFWPSGQLAYKEIYTEGLLQEGSYYNPNGELIASIADGSGFRAIIAKSHIEQLQEYHRGVQEGSVQVFDENQKLICSFFILNGEKMGKEHQYYHDGSIKLELNWNQGALEGVIQTWYASGKLESRKEIYQNKKNGLSSAWFDDGSLMYVEEYDADCLVKGQYYQKAESEPISTIKNGEGIATLFHASGLFLKKVNYQNGKPYL